MKKAKSSLFGKPNKQEPIPVSAWREISAKKQHPASTVQKYGNISVVIDGYKFPSKLEASRYVELKVQRALGLVDFKMQVKYEIVVCGMHICYYIADFVVTDLRTGEVTVEDTKGVETADFRLKKKLMLAAHGIEIKLIKKRPKAKKKKKNVKVQDQQG